MCHLTVSKINEAAAFFEFLCQGAHTVINTLYPRHNDAGAQCKNVGLKKPFTDNAALLTALLVPAVVSDNDNNNNRTFGS